MKPKKLEWHNDKRKVSDLIVFEKNPRKISDKQRNELKTSMEKFNLVEIPAINLDNKIVAGHQRIAVMQLLDRGEEEIDVRVPNRKLTKEEFEEYNLRSNKNTAEWDFDILAEFGADLLHYIGFEEDELSKMFPVDQTDKDDTVPELEKVVKSKLGDIYEFGEHRIMCGDSTSKQDVDKLMNGHKAQMCFTDPPYNVDYTGGMGTHEKNKRSGILNDKMSDDSFFAFLSEVSKRIIENVNGGVYICMSSSELDKLKVAWETNGGHWQSFIIWVKNNFTLSRADHQHTYEPILYGWAEGIVNHYFTGDRDKPNVWEDLRKVKTEFKDGFTTISFQGYKIRIEGEIKKGEVIKKKQRTDIWRHDKPTKSSEHPTMKPVSLCNEAIAGSSRRKDIVLDLFLGSGSTLIASEKSGRYCYGMELDPQYIDVVIQRYIDYTENTKIIKNGEEITW